MKTFTSPLRIIQTSDEKLFSYLGNFNHFFKAMPPQITNWASTENTCSFTIQGMADISMKMKEKTPNSLIIIEPDGKTPFAFELICHIAAKDENSSTLQLEFKADLNPMISLMASKPLQNFVDLLSEKIETIFHQN